MSNCGKSYSTKGNQGSRRILIYVKLFRLYQAQTQSSFYFKYSQISICSYYRRELCIPSNIWNSRAKWWQVCSNVSQSVLWSSKRFSQVLNFLSIDYNPLFGWVTFHSHEIVRMGYVLFVFYAHVSELMSQVHVNS